MRDDSGGGDPPDWLGALAAQRQIRGDTAPAGISLTRALIVPPGFLPRDQALRQVLGTIDAVHGANALPLLTIRWSSLPLGMVARYVATDDLSEAVALSVDPTLPRWRLAVVHEIGHFLDHQGILPNDTLASRADPRMNEWRAAVRGSSGVRRLFSMLGPDAYLTRVEELWARSYAQWIAVKGQDDTLRTEVVESKGSDPTASRFWGQWDDAEFEPIAAAIDRLFRSLGWIV